MDRFAFLRTHGKEDPDEIARRIEAKALTTGAYLEQWLSHREARGLACIRDDKARLRTHVIPRIGEIPLVDLRPHHVGTRSAHSRCSPPRRAARWRLGQSGTPTS